jgi:hypothetical protein
MPPIRQLNLGPNTAIIYMDPPRSGGAGDSGQSRLTSELTAQLAATALPASLTSSTDSLPEIFPRNREEALALEHAMTDDFAEPPVKPGCVLTCFLAEAPATPLFPNDLLFHCTSARSCRL